MTETITSKHNERLKELRKLHERKHRDRSGRFVAEGEDLLAEALRFGALPDEVFYDSDRVGEDDALVARLPSAVTRVAVGGGALDSASTLGSGTRVLATFPQRWSDLGALGAADAALYLHEVSDPGNVGAVLRSALALAAVVVVLSPETADPYGPKAVRASMGAVFGQPVVRGSFDELRAALEPDWRTIALVPGSGDALRDLPRERRRLYCLGSERLGLPGELAAVCDERAHVPLRPGGAESLNVAMTATLCLYETATPYSSGS
jgi:TrmH family RNA methyltransferase